MHTLLFYSAKPNQSMKLMLVGLQNRGKTSLLARLKEVNEVESNATTFNERVMGSDQTTNPSITTSFRPFLKRLGIKEGICYYILEMYNGTCVLVNLSICTTCQQTICC